MNSNSNKIKLILP